MPYLLILKKQHNLQVSSAANYRWRSIGKKRSGVKLLLLFWEVPSPREAHSAIAMSSSIVYLSVKRGNWLICGFITSPEPLAHFQKIKAKQN